MKALSLAVLLFVPALVMADPVAELAGLQVVYDSAEKDFDGFRTFNMEEGHKVALIVRSKGKPMVGFDENKAEITIGGAKAESGFFMSNMSFSKDKKAMKLEFDAKGKVQPNAQGELEVKGKLPVMVASTKAEIRSAVFNVKAGEPVVFPADAKGLPTLKVKKTGKPDYGDEVLSIAFSTNMKMDDFAGVKFLTKDGKEVKSDKGGSSWMGLGGNGSGTVDFNFTADQKELIMVIETWTDKEEKIIEVDLKAALAGK
jgi:hypothetical protein